MSGLTRVGRTVLKRASSPAELAHCLHLGWRCPVWECRSPWGPNDLKAEIEHLSERVRLRERIKMVISFTFTGTDHLQHHFCGPTSVQPCLLIQDFLLFHLLFLQVKDTHAQLSPFFKQLDKKLQELKCTSNVFSFPSSSSSSSSSAQL